MNNIPDELDTAQALLTNPEEVFYADNPKYIWHQENLKMLVFKRVVPIQDGEYLIQKDRIQNFLNNGGKTNDEIALDIAKESLKQAQLSNAISNKAIKNSRISNIIAIISIIIALFTLLNNCFNQSYN